MLRRYGINGLTDIAGLELLMPLPTEEEVKTGAMMPVAASLCMALLTRIANDPTFVEETFKWMNEFQDKNPNAMKGQLKPGTMADQKGAADNAPASNTKSDN